ncbi:cytochrome P450 [Candidatus Poriferisodalis sp.]|uniref:cytochrome P450 n=1 Tax=Candidatus Poriferisodalis sp. TaxID=3101277 RepID=UPI003AF9D5FA
MSDTAPVDDWGTDYDILDPEYVRDPAPVWDELREGCPVAHTERWGGSFLPTRYDDVQTLVKLVPELSNSDPLVTTPPPEVIEENQANPDDGFVSTLLAGTDDRGEPIDPMRVVGMLNLLLIAGIDTTWSSIGSALWHFGTHPADRERMAAEPELWPTAIEELLRFYAPVTMGRLATEDVEIRGVTIPQGSKVIMNFPGANRDPEMFERPDEVILDRPHNRHVAFGAGIHRCAGANLARLEMDIALRTWFDRIPDFEVSAPDEVTWAGGQIRGPRYVPIRFPSAS